MSKPRVSRPSPALVISLIALFVALGGSAYAVNKVGTKDIKNNAVTAAKIKKNAVTTPKLRNNAITTAKLKNGAVTGAKINKSALGAVPRATNADNATSAVSATNAVNAANWNRYTVLGLTKTTPGQTVVLHSVGPFTIFGRCADAGGGQVRAETFATTNQPKSSFVSYEDYYYEADFEPGTEGEINYYVQDSGPETNMSYTYYGQFYMASADGSTLTSGELFSGVNYFGAPCAFWGGITNNS